MASLLAWLTESYIVSEWLTSAPWSVTAAPASFVSPDTVACLSNRTCFIGGDFGIAELKVGQTVSFHSFKLPNGAGNAMAVQSIACASNRDCWAILNQGEWGSFGGSVFEHFDGSSWRVSARLNGIFESVSCADSNVCWAVGNGRALGGGLAARFDGRQWSIFPTAQLPKPPMVYRLPAKLRQRPAYMQSNSADFQSVYCLSATSCWAVGTIHPAMRNTSYMQQRNTSYLVEHYDGHRWKLMPAPQASDTHEAHQLDAVACVQDNQCWATGAVYFQGTDFINIAARIWHWNGTRWIRQWAQGQKKYVFSSGPGIDLSSIACLSARDCWVAGTTSFGIESMEHDSVTLHFDGRTWQDVPTPDRYEPGRGFQGGAVFGLSSVACLRNDICIAVGTHSTSSMDEPYVLVHRQ